MPQCWHAIGHSQRTRTGEESQGPDDLKRCFLGHSQEGRKLRRGESCVFYILTKQPGTSVASVNGLPTQSNLKVQPLAAARPRKCLTQKVRIFILPNYQISRFSNPATIS